MTYKIIRNSIMCPDKTVLESKHGHDFQSHLDKITGEVFSIDGGHSYFKGSVNKVEPTYLHVTTEDPFEVQRDAFTWGTYGKNGNEPKKYIKLKDMTNEHIQAILDTQRHIKGTYVEELFEQELTYRHLNE